MPHLARLLRPGVAAQSCLQALGAGGRLAHNWECYLAGSQLGVLSGRLTTGSAI